MILRPFVHLLLRGVMARLALQAGAVFPFQDVRVVGRQRVAVRAMRAVLSSPARFHKHVDVVLGFRPKPQVIRAHTSWFVAAVQHALAFWNRSAVEHPRERMRVLAFAASAMTDRPPFSIATVRSGRGPQPAIALHAWHAMLRYLVDFCPKTFVDVANRAMTAQVFATRDAAATARTLMFRASHRDILQPVPVR